MRPLTRALPVSIACANALLGNGIVGSYPRPPTYRALALSTSTCEDLGWDPLTRGSDTVCGENSLGLGGCSGELTFDEARLFCETSGARLCSLDDYRNNEAYGSSCGIEWGQKWSSTACENGAIESYSWAIGPAATVRFASVHVVRATLVPFIFTQAPCVFVQLCSYTPLLLFR